MPSFLTPYLFWIKLAGFAIALGAAGYAGHYVTSAVDDRRYAALELKQSKAETVSVQASLDQLQGFIAKMDGAGSDYTAALAAIKADFATIKKELANATLKPLPADCRPDTGRLRVLQSAVAAANKGAGAAK